MTGQGGTICSMRSWARARPARGRSRRRGSVSLLMAVSFTAFLSLMAVIVDLGWIYLAEARISRATRAAAAAATIARRNGRSEEEAIQVAVAFAGANGVELQPIECVVDPLSNNNLLVRIALSRETPLFFSPIFGVHDMTLGSAIYAQALAGSVKLERDLPPTLESTGVIPIGIPHADMVPVLDGTATTSEDLSSLIFHDDQGFQVGQRYMLKGNPSLRPLLEAIVGSAGSNQGALDMPGGGNGAAEYSDALSYGYSGWIAAGDRVQTQPGTMLGPTRTGVTYRHDQDPGAEFGPELQTAKTWSARLVTVPIVRAAVPGLSDMGTGIPDLKNLPYQHSGRIDVDVIGFACFFLEPDPGPPSQGLVFGRFVSYVGPKPAGQEPG